MMPIWCWATKQQPLLSLVRCGLKVHNTLYLLSVETALRTDRHVNDRLIIRALQKVPSAASC